MVYTRCLFLVHYLDGIDIIKDKPIQTIRIQPIYSSLVYLIMVLLCLLVLLFPIFLSWKPVSIWIRIAYYLFFSLLALWSAVRCVQFMQYAVLSEKGILIRNLFKQIVFINWTM